MNATTELGSLIQEVLPEIVALRHELHADPELQYQEHRTRERVVGRLAAAGLTFRPPLTGTDAVAELQGPPGSPIIGLRADMDALPIEETSGVPWASRNAGVMHACGHDGHTSILVGTALVLSKLQSSLPVTVRFIFQPAEEMECGGKLLVQRGVCDGLARVYALHGWPGVAAGEIQCRSGAFFAAADFFTFTVIGRGGHGAMPEKAVSPLPGMAAIIQEVDALHRRLNADAGCVVSICSAHAGGAANNVIPEQAHLEGTARYLNASQRGPIFTGLQEIAARVAAAHGLVVTCDYKQVYDLPAVNAVPAVAAVAAAVTAAGGTYREAPAPTMGAEDFAFFLDRVPGAMFWLGVGEDRPNLHQPNYDFNDNVLALGIETFCRLILQSGNR